MVLDSYLVTGEVKVVVDHIQRPVPQDLLEREDVPAIHQVVDGEGMPAQVSV